MSKTKPSSLENLQINQFINTKDNFSGNRCCEEQIKVMGQRVNATGVDHCLLSDFHQKVTFNKGLHDEEEKFKYRAWAELSK